MKSLPLEIRQRTNAGYPDQSWATQVQAGGKNETSPTKHSMNCFRENPLLPTPLPILLGQPTSSTIYKEILPSLAIFPATKPVNCVFEGSQVNNGNGNGNGNGNDNDNDNGNDNDNDNGNLNYSIPIANHPVSACKVFDGIPQPLPLLIRQLRDKIPQPLSRAPVTNVNSITTATSSLVQSTTPAVATTINAAAPPATAVPQCASHLLPSLPGSAVKVLDEMTDVFDNTSTLDTSNSATLHAVLDNLCNDYKMFDRMLERGNEGSDGESEDARKMFIAVLVRENKMEMESLGLEGLGDLILGTMISKLDPVDAASITWTSTKLEKVVWLSLAMNPSEDYGYVTKWGFDSCTAVGNALIVLYLKCNRIESAVQMFDEIPKRNAGSSNTIIYGLLDLAAFEKAFDQVKCSENGRSRMYIVLTDKELFGFGKIMLPEKSLVAEVVWDHEKMKLCLVCRVLNFCSSFAEETGGDCTIKLSLWFLSILSMENMGMSSSWILSTRGRSAWGYVNPLFIDENHYNRSILFGMLSLTELNQTLISNGVQKKLDYLVGVVLKPKQPVAAIVGGSRVSSKIGVIKSLLERVNILLLRGGMIFTFYKAQGFTVGSSLVEEDKLDIATALDKAKSEGVTLLLPIDIIVANKLATDANNKVILASTIQDGWMGHDIGSGSIKTFGVSRHHKICQLEWTHGSHRV